MLWGKEGKTFEKEGKFFCECVFVQCSTLHKLTLPQLLTIASISKYQVRST